MNQENHQEKPDPGFLETSGQDFPPSHSLVFTQAMSLCSLGCQQQSQNICQSRGAVVQGMGTAQGCQISSSFGAVLSGMHRMGFLGCLGLGDP